MGKKKGFLDDKKKRELLSSEKTKAVESNGMIKTASFKGDMQDPYPSPFLNLSDMNLPRSTIEIFKWCKYYYTFDPLISGAINALATFPVTEVSLEDKNNKRGKNSDSAKVYEKVLFKTLNLYKLLIEIGIDYFLYGNCFIMGELKGKDKSEKEWSNMVRLDPSKMIIDYNPATGTKKFRWTVPQKIREIVKSKSPREEYDKIPKIIKDAVKKNKTIRLNSNHIYHFSRATDSMGEDSVWGVPVVANVLKLLMYRNVLRQAQEAIAREHIVPMRIYYIDESKNMNIHANLEKVAGDLAEEIKKSVKDPNYKVVSPLPVNVINVGGDGRSLLLAPEIDQVQTEILAGMNMPKEFIFGGVSYSGSSISLRILENQFITYRLLLEDFLQNFVIRGMAKARGEWLNEEDDDDLIGVKLSDLKMQDDVQQKQLLVQLNSAQKCSNDFLWKAMGMDPEKMKEAIEKETLDAAVLQQKVQNAAIEEQIKGINLQLELQKKQMEMQMQLQLYQSQLSQQLGLGGDASQSQPQTLNSDESSASPDDSSKSDTNPDAEKEINRIAIQLMKMPERDQTMYLSKIPEQFKQSILKKVSELKSTQQNNESVDMRSMPEQKPPRRDSLK